MARLLEISELTYHYPDGTPALDAVSFRMERGEKVAVLGKTGAGKSTLLLHLNGLLRATQGRVVVDGVPVSEARLREVRRRVGLVFQDPDDQLFLPTLLEDVAFGPLNEGQHRAVAISKATDALAALGLGGREHRAAHHLSGGEKRLAALATVLVSEPVLLALDEPTGNLDAGGRQRIVNLLRGRPEALLLATHDLEVARALTQRALVLEGGKVVVDCAMSRLLEQRGLLEQLELIAPLP